MRTTPAPAPPRFSIVLCTRDRASLLRKALDGLLDIEFPAAAFELCVVDNNSRDETSRVVADFAVRAPFAVRYIFEARPGLSIARNRAVKEASGELLFFTDDDQLVHPGILREHDRVAQAYGARVIQGAIDLTFPAGRPSWLYGPLEVWFGRTGEAAEGSPTAELFGGNMVFRRDLFDEVSAFREDLGKGAAGYSEDSEISQRLRAHGEALVFAPTALVYHIIDADRATAGFLRTAAFRKGRSAGVIESEHRRVASIALSLVRAARQGLTAILLLPSRHRSINAQVLALYYVGHTLGVMAGTGTAGKRPPA